MYDCVKACNVWWSAWQMQAWVSTLNMLNIQAVSGYGSEMLQIGAILFFFFFSFFLFL